MVGLDYRDKEHFRIKFYKNEFIICKNHIRILLLMSLWIIMRCQKSYQSLGFKDWRLMIFYFYVLVSRVLGPHILAYHQM